MAIAVSVASVVRSLDTSSSRINHFGRNPVIGGSPPTEIRVSIIILVINGDSAHVVPIVLIEFIFCCVRVMNRVVTIVM